MTELGIKDAVDKLIDNIGWDSYFRISCPAYIELCREFYTTYDYNKSVALTLSTPGVITFRLMGKDFKLSITDFNVAFGFISPEYAQTDEYLTSFCDFSSDFAPVSLYRQWTATKSALYHPSQSIDNYLRDPILKYVHRFLSFSFSGRQGRSNLLSKTEFYFLWCMQVGKKVNLGWWLADQFQDVITRNHPLILGFLITQLAVQQGLLNLQDTNLHVACEMLPLDFTCLAGMGLVSKKKGRYHFSLPGPLHLH